MQRYQPSGLCNLLQEIQQQKFTGIARFEAVQPGVGEPGARIEKSAHLHLLIFHAGELCYGDSELPQVDRLTELLTQQLKHPLLRMALKVSQEQRQNPQSLWEFLGKVVVTRIVTWEQIESVIYQQTLATLQKLSQSPGWMTRDPLTCFDLSFGSDRHGLDLAQLLREMGSNGPGLGHRAPSPESPAMAEQRPPISSFHRPLAQPAPALQTARAAAIASPERSSLPPLTGQFPNAHAGSKPTGLAKILSVDDSPIVQKMVERTLGKIYEVHLASNALEALKMLNAMDGIQLILLDVNMPGISGLDFCRTVKSIPKFKSIPIIMVTANEGRVNKAKGQIAGSTLYLTKPIEGDKLLEIVHQYVKTPNQTPGQIVRQRSNQAAS
ncbi:MAG: response regulator [Synechococcales cyanobacterium RM1_1_8]|nr:response regulator [Synechococcales cyanobacterium RM1_1_8]